MMAMDGLLLAAKPYLKSKVQAKGWLMVHTKPGDLVVSGYIDTSIMFATLTVCMKIPFVCVDNVDHLIKAC